MVLDSWADAIMIWVAIAIEILLACLEEGNFDIDAGILCTQIMNGLVGWYEGRKADDAIAALKVLGPPCSVVRDGRKSVATTLRASAGDIVKLFGNAVPRTAKFWHEGDRVDQAALTGESIPKRMGRGDV